MRTKPILNRHFKLFNIKIHVSINTNQEKLFKALNFSLFKKLLLLFLLRRIVIIEIRITCREQFLRVKITCKDKMPICNAQTKYSYFWNNFMINI